MHAYSKSNEPTKIGGFVSSLGRPSGRPLIASSRSVLDTTFAVHVAVLDFFLASFANGRNLNVEVEVLAC